MDGRPTITTGLGVTIPPSAEAAPGSPQPFPRPAGRFGKRVYRGFGVVDRAGNLAWGTLRGTPEAAHATWLKWNPAPPEHPQGETVRKITVTIEPGEI
ncbi:hypothetical protein [Siccirubricoccus phaeus]|uniref:hypothetical protein n=1 Tax=Siccirubricoccus phaeus TaxID=2595053 RepID=UPI0011F18B1C|nr:hypothetical protein [Siccirubricoccus phaeus]